MRIKYVLADDADKINELIEKGFRLHREQKSKGSEPLTLVFIKN